MELGLSPIITAGMLLQLLCGARMIEVNMRSKEDRELYQSALKFFSLLIASIQATAYLLSGMYGPVALLGLPKCLLIVGQLVGGTMVAILMDELLQKGYGLGSGMNLFIGTSICQMILWKTFSFKSLKVEDGTEFEGCVIAFFHFLFVKPNKLYGMQQAFFRSNAANLINLFSTFIIAFIVIYFQVSLKWFLNILIAVVQSRAESQQPQNERIQTALPHQVVLHRQCPHRAPLRRCPEYLLYCCATCQIFRRQLLRQPRRSLGKRVANRIRKPSGRPGLLHQPTDQREGGIHRPDPRSVLLGSAAGLLRLLRPHLDRHLGHKRSRPSSPADGARNDHQGHARGVHD
jgi:hypothetical protein